MIVKFLQGMAIGLSFILPGLSTGTIFLILGIYRTVLDDLVRLRIRPYIPHLVGGAFGIITSIRVFGYLVEHHYALLGAFLLGMLLASIRVLIAYTPGLRPNLPALALAAAGFSLSWFVFGKPAAAGAVLAPGSLLHFFLGGAVAGATMLLPGVSGSAALVIMKLYDDLIVALNQVYNAVLALPGPASGGSTGPNCWLQLLFFVAGAVLGLLGLARLLTAAYRRYAGEVTFLLSGLILGSTRALLPARFTLAIAVAMAAGASLVLLVSRPKKANP
jgi:putative membrane protein